jgi:hypothetical protein
MLQGLIEGEGEEIVRKLIARAKRGDALSVRLVVERLLPRAVPQHRVELPIAGLARAGDIVDALGVVLRSVGAGEMSLEEARQFAAILEGQRRAIETADLAVRIEALEGVEAAKDEEVQRL